MTIEEQEDLFLSMVDKCEDACSNQLPLPILRIFVELGRYFERGTDPIVNPNPLMPFGHFCGAKYKANRKEVAEQTLAEVKKLYPDLDKVAQAKLAAKQLGVHDSTFYRMLNWHPSC